MVAEGATFLIGVAFYNPHQPASQVKCTNAVGKPGMRRTRKHELRETELRYSTQSLKRRGLNDAPECMLKLVRVENYEVV
jgi:hypothetical protein